jgi:hypothetical protein
MEPDEALTMAIVLPLVGAAAVTSPFWGPAYFLDDSLSKAGYFPFHPYAAGFPGYMQIDGTRPVPVDGREATFGDPDYVKSWSVRLSVEDGNDFRGLNRLNGRLVIDTTMRLGLWTNWNYLHESLDGGRTDDTLLSDTDLTYRVAQSDWLVVHIGAGLRMLNDRMGSRFGGNFLYSADIFPVEPLVISALIDGGWLDSAGVIHGRATVGVIRRSWEVYLGYDFMRIGSVNIQGPLAGVRFWF